jgi:hypothetical protein
MVKKQTLQDLDNPMVENQQKPQKFPQAEPKKLAEMGL